MLQLPSEIDKESEAKKGILKLMLVLIRGNINIKSPTVSNILSVPPSKGMLQVAKTARSQKLLADAILLRTC